MLETSRRDLAPLQQLLEIGAPKALHQDFLGIAPHRSERAVVIEGAVPFLAHTLVQHDRAVDGLDHIQKRDLLGGSGQRYPAACPRDVCNRPAMDNCEMILARNDGGMRCSSATVLVAARSFATQAGKIQNRTHCVVGLTGDLHGVLPLPRKTDNDCPLS